MTISEAVRRKSLRLMCNYLRHGFHGLHGFTSIPIEDLASDLYALAKVDQKADFDPGGLEIVDELCFVSGVQFFDCFQFEDYFFLDDDVCDVVTDDLIFVTDLDGLLFDGLQTGIEELDQECVLVDGF